MLTACGQSPEEYIKWHDLQIPLTNVLSGKSKYVSNEYFDDNNDIAVKLELPAYGPVFLTLDHLNNVDKSSHALRLNKEFEKASKPSLNKHESGYFIFDIGRSKYNWELVEQVLNDNGGVENLSPVALCTTTSLRGDKCNFSIYSDDLFVSLSLSNEQLAEAKEVISSSIEEIDKWKVVEK